MQRKELKLFLFVIGLLAVLLISFCLVHKLAKSGKVVTRHFVNTDFFDSTLSTSSGYNKLLLFYFDPYCEYCKDEMDEFSRKAPVKDSYLKTLFFSVSDSAASVQALKQSNIPFSVSISYFFDKNSTCRIKLNITHAPTLYLYNRSTKKIEKYEGAEQCQEFIRKNL